MGSADVRDLFQYIGRYAAHEAELELQLRAVSKKQHGDVAVRSIENAAKNPQEIDRWIKSIEDLHRSKPPPQVHYRKAMPDIDKLMEEWEPEFEELLKTTPLPDENLEVTLAEFAKIACGLLDVPVYDSIVESLHVLFSVYLEFTENVHFQQQVPADAPQVMTN